MLTSTAIKYAQPEWLQTYGHISVDQPLPSFKALSVTDGQGPEAKPIGRFQIHYIDASGNTFPCIDGTCLPEANRVVQHGGHFQIHDSKVAHEFGIPTIHNGVRFEFADSLMVIVDAKGIVVAIYRNIAPTDVDIGIAAAEGKVRLIDKFRRGLVKLRAIWPDLVLTAINEIRKEARSIWRNKRIT